MTTEQRLKQDLDRGKNLSKKDSVWNHRENPEGILRTIAEMTVENPEMAFSTKEIKKEYMKGLEPELSRFMDNHEKWNPISWFAQQHTTGNLPDKSRDMLERWFNILERRHVDGYWHYTLDESYRSAIEDYLT